jgi:hypothetical protein
VAGAGDGDGGADSFAGLAALVFLEGGEASEEVEDLPEDSLAEDLDGGGLGFLGGGLLGGGFLAGGFRGGGGSSSEEDMVLVFGLKPPLYLRGGILEAEKMLSLGGGGVK